jgi:chromosome partitioning protein
LMLFSPGASFRKTPVLTMRNFELIPASSALTKAMRKLNRPTDVFWIKEALEAGHDFDVVVLDTAAAVTVFSLNALVASDQVVIPSTPEYQPVLGAEQTFQTVMLVKTKLNPDLPKPFFILTRVDGRKRVHGHYNTYLRKKYGNSVLTSYIRTSTSLVQTNQDGNTVFDRDMGSRGAVDYANVTDELIRRLSLAEKRAQKDSLYAPPTNLEQSIPNVSIT